MISGFLLLASLAVTVAGVTAPRRSMLFSAPHGRRIW